MSNVQLQVSSQITCNSSTGSLTLTSQTSGTGTFYGQLYTTSGTPVGSAVALSNGSYTFAGLSAGSYYAVVFNGSNTNCQGSSGAATLSNPTNCCTVSNVQLQVSSQITCNSSTGSLTLTSQTSGSGTFYGQLYTTSGTPVGSAVALSNGSYTFAGLSAGSYYAVVFNGSNTNCQGSSGAATLSNPTNCCTVSNVQLQVSSQITCNSSTGSLTLTSQTSGTGTFYGQLYTTSGTPVGSAVALSNGSYTFAGLSAGSYYAVVFNGSNTNCQGSSGAATLSNPTNCCTVSNVQLQVSSQITCNSSTGSLTLTSQTSGTGTFYGQLYTTSGTPVGSAVALSNGSYTFAGLSAGSYYAVVFNGSNTNCQGSSGAATLTNPTNCCTIGQPSLTIVSAITCAGNDGSVGYAVSGAVGMYVQLYNGGSLVAASTRQVPSSGTDIYSGLGPGNYTVRVYDPNNSTCQQTSSAQTLSNPPSLQVMAGTSTQPTCPDLNDGVLTYTVTNSTAASLSATATGTTAGSTSSRNATVQNQGGGQFALTFSNLAPGNYNIAILDGNNCPATSTGTLNNQQCCNLQVAITSSSQPTCAGSSSDGSITFNVSGISGSATLTLYRNNVAQTPSRTVTIDGSQPFSGLGPGSYYAILSSGAGCSDQSGTQNLADPGPCTCNLSITESVTHLDCHGATNGSIDVTVTGGTPPYTYAWTTSNGSGLSPSSEDQSGLSAGTYTLSVADNGNCSTIKDITITAPTDLSIVAAVDHVTCNGAADGSIDVAVSGGTSPHSYSWTTSNGSGLTQGQEDQSGLSAGRYDLVVTDDNNCTVQHAETIAEPTALSLTLADQAVCPGETTNLPAAVAGGTAPYNYLWNTGATTSTLSGVGAGNYSLTVTDDNGCQAIATADVTETGSPTVSINGPTEVCANESITFSATPIISGATYAWTFSGSASPSTATGTTVSVTFSSSGTSTVQLTVTNGTCSGSDQMDVTIRQPIEANGGANATICQGGSTILDGSASVGTDFTWTIESGDPTSIDGGANTSMLTVSPLFTTVYKLTVKDASGICERIDYVTVDVDVNQGPSVSATVTDASCGQSNGEIALQASNGQSPYSYSWGHIADDIATATGLAAGKYYYTVTDDNGCFVNDSSTINASGGLDLVLAQGDATCPGGFDGTIDLTVTGGTTPYTFDWTTTNGTGIVQGQEDQLSLGAGTYNVVVTDDNNCTASASATISEPAAIVITLVDQSVCTGETVDIPSMVVGGTSPYSYLWNTGATSSTLTAVGQGTYSLTVTDDNNCTAQEDVTITETTGLTITIHGPDTVCAGETVTYSVSPIVTGAIYSWTFGGPATPSSGTGTSASVTFTSPGSGAVSVLVSGTSCPGSANKTVLINEAVIADAGNDLSVCQGGSMQIDGSASVGTDYTWTIVSGDPTSIDGSNKSQVLDVSPLFTTVYRLTVKDATGICEVIDEVTVNVDVSLNPTAVATVAQSQYCAGQTVTLDGSSSQPPASDPNATLNYLWFVGPPVSANFVGLGQTLDVAANTTTEYTLILSADGNATTCSDTAVVTVTVVDCTYDLALTKNLVSAGPFSPGDQVTFTIVVTNEGSLDGANVEVTDNPQTGLAFVSSDAASNSNVTEYAANLWTIASLPRGASETINVTYDIATDFQGTSLLNRVQITADDGDDVDSDPDEDYSTDDRNDGVDDDDEDEVSVPVGQVYDLALTKNLVSSGPFSPGDQVTFAIVVTNEGSLDGANVEVTDNPQTGLAFVSSDAASNSNVTEDAANLWTIASLPNGASETINVTYDIATDFQGTSLLNRVQITTDDGDDVDSDPDEDYSTDDGNDGVDDDDEDEVSVPVGQVYDLALTKNLVSSGPFSPGDQVTFAIVVINEGSLDGANIEVTDNPQTGLAFVSSDAASNSNVTEDAANLWTIASLPRGASETINVTYDIATDFQGTSLLNRVQITADDGDDVDSDPDEDYSTDDGSDGVDDDDEDEVSILVEQTYDLALAKMVIGQGPFRPGDIITYRITVTNEGRATASNVEVTDNPGAHLTFVSSNATSLSNVTQTNDSTYVIGLLLAFSTQDIEVTYRIDPDFMGDQVVNRAQITRDDGDDEDSDPDRDYDEDEDGDNDPDDDDEDEEITPVEQTYDLALAKSLVSAGPFRPGDQITFAIVVTNEGSLDAAAVEVTDNPGTGLTFASSDAGSNSNVSEDADNRWTIASLVSGATETIQVTYDIDANFQGTTLVNRAQITVDDGDDVDSDPDEDYDTDDKNDDTPDDDEDEVLTPMTLAYDLALTKVTMTAGPYHPDMLISYRIRVTNQGNADAANVEITDDPGPGLTFVNSNATGNISQDADNLWTIASLPVGSIADIMVAYRIQADYQGDQVLNRAQISRDNGDDRDSDPDGDYEQDEDGDGDPDDDDEDEVTIPITPPCTSQIGITPTVVSPSCEGGSDGSITLVVSNGTAPYHFHWSTGATSQNLANLSAGTYGVTVEDALGCSASTSVQVSDPASMQLRIAVTDATCSQQNGALDLQVTGRGSMSYRWSTGAISEDLTNLAPGRYEVTVSDAQNCQKVAAANVGRNMTDLQIQVSAGDLTCQSGQTQLSVQSPSVISVYQWTGPNGFTSNEAQPTVSQAGSYTLQVTDAVGCVGTGQVQVAMDRDEPDIQATGGSLGCQGSVQLQGASSSPGVIYTWTGPGGFSSNAPNPTVDQTGTYTLQVTGTNGCTAQESVQVIDGGEVLDFTLSAGQLNCTNATVQIVLSISQEVTTVQWIGPQGFASDVRDPVVSTPGIYQVTVTDVSGCSGTQDIEISRNLDLPDVQATGGTIDCAKDKVQLKGESLTAGATYRWVGPNGFTSDQASPVVETPGVYTLVVAAPNGCTNEAIAQVLTRTEGPDIQVTGTQVPCGQDSTTLGLNVTNASNWTVLWTGPNGFRSNLPMPTVGEVGTYGVTATLDDGCKTEESFEVTRSEDIDFVIHADTFDCDHPAVHLDWESSHDIERAYWIDPNGLVINEPRPIVTVRGIYQLILESSKGCVDTGQIQTVDNTIEPDVQAEGGLLDGCDTQPLRLFGFSGTPGVTYQWTGPDGFLSTDPRPYVRTPGRYLLSVTAPNGCEVITSVNVLLDSCEMVGDRVWLDADCDGIQDSLETGLAGIQVELYTCDSILVDSQMTDSLGHYRFVHLIPGEDYFLRFIRPDSLQFTVAEAGDSTLDSDVVYPDGRTRCFRAEENVIDMTWDAGFCMAPDTTDCKVQIIATRYDCRADSALLEVVSAGAIVSYGWRGPQGFSSALPAPIVPAAGTYYVETVDTSGCIGRDTIHLDTMELHDLVIEEVTVPCDSMGVWASVISTLPIHTKITWIGPDGRRVVGDSAMIYEAGLYWIVVEDTVSGCYDKFLQIFHSACCNILDGGLLGYDESNCGGYDPDEIISVIDPTGGSGVIEYMWIKTTDPSLPFSKWDPIWRADGPTYDPLPISVTTYYARCSRRRGCTAWLGETNVIRKEVRPEPSFDPDSVQVTHEASCDARDGVIRLLLHDTPLSVPYMARIVKDDTDEILAGPFTDREIVFQDLAPGTYHGLEVLSAAGCFSQVGDTTYVVEAYVCQQSAERSMHVAAYPNPAASHLQVSVRYPDDRQGRANIDIVDLLGARIAWYPNQEIRDGVLSFITDVSHYAAGLYIVRVTDGQETRTITVEILRR